MKIGLLTGTFDPIHAGHLELARAAAEASAFDEVWLMVNPQAGDSAGAASHKAGVADFRHRLAMAGLAAEGAQGVQVYRGPGHDRPHTMQAFLQVMPVHGGAEFVFITGMDVIAHLDRWNDVESVVNNATFAVAHRPGTGVRTVDGLRSRLGELGSRLRVSLFEFEGHNRVSSSVVRADLRAGERPAGLDPRVHEYILEHGLYR